MPVRNLKSPKSTRTLRKTPPLELKDASIAQAAVAAVRRAACATTDLQSFSVSSNANPRQYLVVINPASGRGAGPRLYSDRVHPILQAAGICTTVLTTSSPGHATELVKAVLPGAYDAILAIGGDGTTFEVLQGVLDRPDWDAMRVTALMQVPCGSGNALAACTGLWDVETAAHAAVKRSTTPLDVSSVVQFGAQSRRMYSFLSLTYGMLSCLDIGTEHLRWMGSTRFVVGALQQIIGQRTFSVRLAYLEQAPAAAAARDEGEEHSATDNSISGDGPPLQHLPAAFKRHDVESVQELPAGWQWMPADEIQLLAACNLPRLDMNFHFAPEARLDSGHVNVLYTAGRAGRRRGFELLTSSEKGEHMHLVEQHKPIALWLEPKGQGTWLVVDGEQVPHRPVYAEVHPGLCRVIVSS